MTREEKLYSMRMQDLEVVAAKLGIKINKKGAKAKAIEKILEAENAITPAEKPKAPEKKPVEKPKPTKAPETSDEQPLTPKRGQEIEYNGKSQNICAWAKELGKSPNTLYGRLYKLGWSVEDAFTK